MNKILVFVLFLYISINASNALECVIHLCYVENGVCKDNLGPKTVNCLNGKCFKVEGN